MGVIFSKQEKYHIHQTKLITTIYCEYCKNSFLFNEYYKHIIQCKREYKNLRRELNHWTQ